MRLSITARTLALSTFLLPVVVGCGGVSEPNDTSTAAKPTENATTAAPNVPQVIDGEGTAPAQSVAIFLDSLRRGDERAANAVLTTKAREEMAKTAYVLQPLGTPEGQYTIGRVGFPYAEDKSVALVECNWTEPPVVGEPQLSMDIVCEVHNEANEWRISGIGVTLTGTEDALVLDFEDAQSLQATIEGATGQATPPTNTQTTAASGQTTGLRANPTAEQLPELPNFPAPAQLPAGQDANSQIALPPMNSPVLR
ncbi:MAG: hypothetical protein R3C53_23595 [Pirellulaceae bacterium]